MMFLIFSAVLTLTLGAEYQEVLDHNSFLIYNRVYHEARLAQWGTGYQDVGSYEHDLYPDQLWFLDPHPTQPGCYYLENEKYTMHRLADWENQLITYSGSRYDDQLWRFGEAGEGFYYIENCYHTSDRLAKWGPGDEETGVYGGDDYYDDQHWSLVPRHQASVRTSQVFHFDNRQGSAPIIRSVSITHGVKRTSTSTITSTNTYKLSVTASLNAAIKIFTIGVSTTAKFIQSLESSFSSSVEESWSTTEETEFIVPAGKNYKVMQHVVDFAGQFSSESSSLYAEIKIFESNTNDFADPDNFIINT